MKTAVFAGSFCPVTKGHVNVIERAAKLAKRLIVVIPININKNYIISLADRERLLARATKHIPNVAVMTTGRALVDFCKEQKADFIIKSVRNPFDLQYETDMADINYEIGGIETVFLAADKRYSTVSSTYVRELAAFGQDISRYVPDGLDKEISRLLKP